MKTTEPAATQINSAVEKFYKLNDDMDAMQAVTRKVFFEFLRTNTLSTDELDTISTVANLLAELSKAKRSQTNA